MSTPILATKLYIPSPRPKVVLRPRLIERLNEGLSAGRRLTIISAPAGFGKTTLVSEWVATLTPNPSPSGRGEGVRVAWLSLDVGDNDTARFLTYLVAALRSAAPNIGEGVLGALQSPQPPPPESILTTLLNEITTLPDNVILVMDDYHVIDSKPIDHALTFLLEHLPSQMHLVIATRQDPDLPLARLRASGQLTELRIADLRFTLSEAAEFLNQGMGLKLSAEDIAALETRTEGWIAGLQLAAISMQGHPDTTRFIRSFAGSHHFVMDYLVEEVLQQQSEHVQTFLLRTSILDRICGSLCDAILLDSSASGQATLEYLERANLFIVPLDNERRWYRYHHLFADLLRQRLSQSDASSTGGQKLSVDELHRRASVWYETNGLEVEAFHHAVAANDVDHAAYLVEGKGLPLIFRGVVTPVLNWLASLPATTLDSRPSLWVIYASALLIAGQLNGVEPKLLSAEAALALRNVELNDLTKDLIGHIAAIRATMAILQNQPETVIAQSRRALEYLHPNNLPVRTSTIWTMGEAYQLRGERAAARQAYSEAVSISRTIGHVVIHLLASVGLGNIQEVENQLHLASETYQHVLQIAGDPPLAPAWGAHLGLARIHYEWNDLETAERHAQKLVQLGRPVENGDRFLIGELWLARVKLAQGDALSASMLLAQATQSVSSDRFWAHLPETITAQTLLLLGLGNLTEALQLAQTHALPVCEAQVYVAQGDATAALTVLEAAHRQAQVKDWADELLNILILQAAAMHMLGERAEALRRLGEALSLAEPEGFTRLFIDKGLPMAQLLTSMKDEAGRMKEYVHRLLVAFREQKDIHPSSFSPQPLSEPLSQRELEVLHLIAQGLSNDEIGKRLFLALDTVKGHNRRIFDKLQVQRRTEAVARARELGLL